MSAESILHRILEGIEKFGSHMAPRFMAGGVRVPPIPYPDCYRELPRPNIILLDAQGRSDINISCPGLVLLAATPAAATSNKVSAWPGSGDDTFAAFNQFTAKALHLSPQAVFLPTPGQWTIQASSNTSVVFWPDPQGVMALLNLQPAAQSNLWTPVGDVVLAPATDTQIAGGSLARRGFIIQNVGAAPARVRMDGAASAAATGIELGGAGTTYNTLTILQCAPNQQIRVFSTVGTTVTFTQIF
jgi:hypothetical protein